MPTSAKIKALLKQANVPGISIATISSEGIISGQTAGVINTETRDAVTNSTLFQAASLSKPVFAYIVLKMVERGMFSRPGETPESGLDRPLHEICDFGPPHLRNHPNYKLLTPRILLSHQAGLPNWFRGVEAYVATTGTRFDYSGEAYRFLNEVVEHVAGRYDLGLMSETKRDPRKIYLDPTTEGLQYEVISLDGTLKKNTIPWDKLPEDFPRNPSDIIQSQVRLASILLDYTSKADHTLAGKPLHELSREIFDKEPLKMSHSGFVPPPEGSTALKKRAIGHKADDTPDKRQPPSGPILANPAASLVTTAEDYAKFLNVCLRDEFIRSYMFEPQLSLAGRDHKAMDAQVSEETLRQMSWGIGMGLQTADNGDTIAFHWGDNETSRALTAINLRTNEAAVCFTNSANGPALFRDLVEPVVGNLDAVSEWLSTRKGLPLQQNVKTTIQTPVIGKDAGMVNIEVSGWPPSGKMMATITYIPNHQSPDAEPPHEMVLAWKATGHQTAMQKGIDGRWTATLEISPNESSEFEIQPNLKPGELRGKPDNISKLALMNGKIVTDAYENPRLPETQQGRLEKYIYRPNGFLSGPVDDNYKLAPTETGKLVDIYFPAGYQASSTQRYNMQVMLDGDLHLRQDPYGNSMGTKNILDNLIAERKMEPVIAVFIAPTPPTLEGPPENRRFGHTPRLREYACDLETDKLLADLPRALRDSRIPVTAEPSKTSLCGQSMGGLQAIYTAKKHPDIYGQVIAQSPSVYWGPPEARLNGQENIANVRANVCDTWCVELDDREHQQYLLKMIKEGKDSLTGQVLPQEPVQIQLQAGALEDGRLEGHYRLKQDTIQLADKLDCQRIIHDGGHTPDAWAAGLAIMLPVAHPNRAPAPVEARNCQDSTNQYRQEISEFKAAAAARSAKDPDNTNNSVTSAHLPDMK